MSTKPDSTNKDAITAAEDAVDAPTEVVASNDPVPPEAIAEPTTPGEYLRAQREKIGMSVPDLAMRLRMSAKQIEALERGDYATLPSGTFLRGFVRNIAKAVHADAARAIALLEQNNAAATAAKSPTIIPPSQNIKVVPPGGELATPKARLAIVGVVVLLLAGAVWYWWEYVRPHLASGGRPQPVAEAVTNVAPPTTTAPEKAEQVADAAAKPAVPIDDPKSPEAVATLPPLVPVTVPALAATAPAAKPVTPSVTTAGTQAPVVKPAAPAAATAAAAPVVKPAPAAATNPVVVKKDDAVPKAASAPASGANSLGFTFSGESWVEVIDANGKTLVSRRFKAGEAEEATGRAPFSIVIGNAQVTRMAYNGKEFDLAPHTRVSVARVTVK